jgi:superfamily I DNA/RNA helicase
VINVNVWNPSEGLILEPNALRAAKERDRCLALTAGPGAGKTEMLAQRADFLLRTGVCRFPKRILAISFKVDASKNLKDRVRRRCGSELSSRLDSYTFHAFAKRIIDRFRPILTSEDALDAGYRITDRTFGKSNNQIEFGDLIPLAIKILKKSKIVRNAIRQTYSDVFLDEFQDCTNLQYDLVKLAFKKTGIRLTAVGDTKQKIMGWAGALDGIFETFAGDFDAIPLNLYRNFRSKPSLLRMQNRIIKVLDPASVMPDEQLLGEEGEVFIRHFPNSQMEAAFLADLISGWINQEGLAPSEIAVLVSKQLNLYADCLMTSLMDRGIPFRNEQELQDISVEPVARLIVDYLSCLYGQCKPKAWVRLMEQLMPFADEDIQSSVRKTIDQLINKQRRMISAAGNGCGWYSDWWKFAREFLNAIGLHTIVALSPDYETSTRLKEVVKEVKLRIEELLKMEPELPDALDRFSDDQAIRILTIHKSKGLEFDSVIILGVEVQTFWGKEDEERCAYFVGISRAKKRLVLTSSDFRAMPSSRPSRWNEHRTPHVEFLGYADS